MKDLLAPEQRSVLEEAAKKKLLVGLDFDGTLAPIVLDPEAARMRSSTRALLAELCTLYPTAVVSGRSRPDVMARLEGAPVLFVAGNHGLENLEPHPRLEEFERQSDRIFEALFSKLDSVEGVELEHKRYTVSVHYRRSPEERLALRAIGSAVSALPFPVRQIAGKKVVNLVPVEAPHKGTALSEFQKLTSTETVLFVGDDITDEDAFEVGLERDWLTVRIGESPDSKANFFTRSQVQIDDLLRIFVMLRSS